MSEAIGWVSIGLAALIGALNFYLSFLSGPLHHLRGLKSQSNSGLPMIGSIFLLVALVCLWSVKTAWITAGLIALIDTGGLPWFAAVMAIRGIVARQGWVWE